MISEAQTSMMNYTPHYNSNEEKEERPSLSFSFSAEEKPASVPELMSKVRYSLQRILNSRFGDWEKKRIDEKHQRLNFACPYCGDSHADSRKKRGNLYYGNSMYYKCYNCGKYRSVDSFLKDFDESLNPEEIVLAREMEKRETSSSISIDPSILLDQVGLATHAVERSEIEALHGLVPVVGTPMENYLKKRMQTRMELFSWSEAEQQLYIFHLIPGTSKVLGYQIRNFKKQPKYLTFYLSKIYESMDREVTPEVLEIDEISTIFGILEINISQPITVLEGPLDSFLIKNAVATCSTNVEVPIEFSTLRYMYDYDKAGKEAALAKAQQGKPVFLWKKLLSALCILDPIKKMDLTDLLVYCKRKNLKFPRLGEYFSKDKYDIYDL